MARRQLQAPIVGVKLQEAKRRVADGINASRLVLQELGEKKRKALDEAKLFQQNKETAKAEKNTAIAEAKEAKKQTALVKKELKDIERKKDVLVNDAKKVVGEAQALKKDAVEEVEELNVKIDGKKKELSTAENTFQDKKGDLDTQLAEATTKAKELNDTITTNNRTISQQGSKIIDLDVDIVVRKKELEKTDNLLGVKVLTIQKRNNELEKLNKEKDEIIEVEIKGRKKEAESLKEENEEQKEELEKNRKINLALIRKSRRIPQLLSTIEDVYAEAGIKLNLR